MKRSRNKAGKMPQVTKKEKERGKEEEMSLYQTRERYPPGAVFDDQTQKQMKGAGACVCKHVCHQ